MCVRVLAARYAPESCLNLVPRSWREQGMPGARCTRGLVCNKCEEFAHEHTGTVGTLRHSLRNGSTAYGALSLETNSSCLHRRRIEGRTNPGRALSTSGGLTPATGARTTRFCRTHQRRSSCAPCSLTDNRPANIACARDAAASTASCPTFVTMANAPLSGQDGVNSTGDLPDGLSGIFFTHGLDRISN